MSTAVMRSVDPDQLNARFEVIPPLVARSVVLQSISRATGVVTDLSAAALWGMPLPVAVAHRLLTDPVVTSRGHRTHRDRHHGVRGRRTIMPEEQIHEIAGLRASSPTRTWLDCAAWVSVEFCVAMGDYLLSAQLASTADIDGMVAWGSGRRGIRTARQAAGWLDAGSESPRESWLRASLRRHGVPAPIANIDVWASGVWLARVDLAWPEFRVAVEYDGREHHGPERAEHDARRRDRLRASGWIVVVVRNEHLDQPFRIAIEVLGWLRMRGWRPDTVHSRCGRSARSR